MSMSTGFIESPKEKLNIMNTYRELQKAVYAIIHKEGIPLEIRCGFMWGGDYWTVNCNHCEKGSVFAFSCTGGKHYFTMVEEVDKWDYKYKRSDKDEIKEIEILGLPLSLRSVLRAIGVKNEEPEFDYDINFVLQSQGLCIYNQDTEIKLTIDLTKPISEQEEACKALLELLIK